MAETTITVTLRNSFRYQGQMYGPGAAVDVPEGLARALGLEAVSTHAEPAKHATASTHKTTAKKAAPKKAGR